MTPNEIVPASGLLPAQRILVIRYRFIGDTILTAPFLRNLRRAYPQATIDVLVGPSSGEVLAGCPYVNEFIPFDTTRFHKYDSGHGQPRNLIAYAVELRRRSYDLVLVLKRSWSSGLLAWLTAAKFRVGYNTEGRRLFLTHPVPWDKAKHEVESTLDVARAAGIPVTDNYLEAWVSKSEKAEIIKLVPELASPHKRVLVHAAAAHPDKMYPLQRWAEVLRQLKQDYGILPFFTGSPPDRLLYEQLQQISGVTGVNLCGQLTLRQSLALYEHMQLSVCVDSGPAHMSAAVGTPTIAIFGPTDPGRWRPWGANHVAVFDPTSINHKCSMHTECKISRCLGKLSSELIISECAAALDRL